jgi:hypothetical protein
LAIFFLFPSKQFLPISFKFSCGPIPPPPTPHRLYSLSRYFGRKVQLGAANRRQKLGLVWRNRKKISQIINDYLCLQFFLLIILWTYYTTIFQYGILFCFAFSYALGVREVESVHHWAGYPSKKRLKKSRRHIYTKILFSLSNDDNSTIIFTVKTTIRLVFYTRQ